MKDEKCARFDCGEGKSVKDEEWVHFDEKDLVVDVSFGYMIGVCRLTGGYWVPCNKVRVVGDDGYIVTMYPFSDLTLPGSGLRFEWEDYYLNRLKRGWVSGWDQL